MLNLLGKLMGRKVREHAVKDVKCLCGQAAMLVSTEKPDIYFCQECNKLIYYLDPSLNDSKVKLLSLGRLKRNKNVTNG